MKTLRIALCIMALAALGCRVNSGQVLLEQEARLLEDRIWELEACLEDCYSAREATIRENEALKRELAGRESSPADSFRSPASDFPRGGPSRATPPKLEVPTIELPEPTEAPAVEMPGEPVEAAPLNKQSRVIEGTATQLVINKRLTGGLDRDGHNGDEGVMVVFEPRNDAGEVVRTPGDVSVVVMDPAQEGEAARVARWDFKSHEVGEHFQKTLFGQAYEFELPWPSRPPKSRDLQLFVRYTTPEGQKITVDAPLEVRTPLDPPRTARQHEPIEEEPEIRVPSSRVKQGTSTASRARQGELDAEPPRQARRSSPRRESEAPRQATRSDRPAWRPYR